MEIRLKCLKGRGAVRGLISNGANASVNYPDKRSGSFWRMFRGFSTLKVKRSFC